MSRIENHIILGEMEKKKWYDCVDGKKIPAVEGEPNSFCTSGK